jgi:hypothetical protein
MQAIADGKTHKRWITEKDNRVRLSHKLLDGKTIEIRKLFYPGGVPMRFPKDYEYAEAFPRELIGCRCNIKYLTRNTEFEDVTSEYIEKAKPGQGTYSFEKGFADKNGEEKTGMWIFNTFGGNLRFLPENGHPDYMWNNKLWELKTPEEPNGVQKLVHKGLHQIAQNSGGIVLDIQKLNISLDEIEKKALKRIISSSQSDLDLMIIDDRNFLKVLRYVKYK